MLIKPLIFISMLFVTLHLHAQSPRNSGVISDSLFDFFVPDVYLTDRSIQIGDSTFLMLSNCKSFGVIVLHHPVTQFVKLQPVSVTVSEEKIPFITAHGNVLYNFNYKSYIDTPFAQSNVMQHLVQTNVNLLLKGTYPLKMTVSSRINNSPFFKNSTDVNIQFNQSQMLGIIKRDLKKKVENLVSLDQYQLASMIYQKKLDEVKTLQAWVNNPARATELLHEKEGLVKYNITEQVNTVRNSNRAYLFGTDLYEQSSDYMTPISKESMKLYNEKHGLVTMLKSDSIKNTLQKKAFTLVDSSSIAKAKNFKDSLQGKAKKQLTSLANKKENILDSTGASAKYKAAKQRLDSLKKQMVKYENKVKETQKKVSDSIVHLKSQINSVTNVAGLTAFMKKNHIADSTITKSQKLLLSVSQFGIGRNWIDYSELTVRNISLAGVNIEMNPGNLYLAAATGKVNYRFRDFIIKNNSAIPDQSLNLIRIGVGRKDGNSIIGTFYNGKKSVLGGLSDTGFSPVQQLLGFSLEGRLALNQNTYLIAEVAKSSFGNNLIGQKPSFSELVGKATNMSIKTNYAYSVKLMSQFPQTNSRFTGYYRSFGKDFQSFNLMPANIKTEAWMLKIDQYLWNKKLAIEASVKKNDFTSAFSNPVYSSQSVFKSFQVSVRVPKYPFVSVGFFPTSQLSLSNRNVLMESQYNTLNAVVSHSYQLRKISMNSNAVYTRFYNTSQDTGFIYFNATSWSVNHSVFLYPLTLQTSIGVTNQSRLYLFTLEQMAGYQFKKLVTIGASLKWNRLNHSENLMGGTASLGLNIKKLGTLQFNYDKSFLPGYNRQLIPVDIGRMTFYREF